MIGSGRIGHSRILAGGLLAVGLLTLAPAARAQSGSLSDRWSVSLGSQPGGAASRPGDDGATAIPLQITQIGGYGVSLASPYNSGLWAAYAGSPAPATAPRVAGFDLSGWRVDIARPAPLAAAGLAGGGGSALALRWGMQMDDNWQVAFGSTVTVGGSDGGSFAVTPVQSVRAGDRPGTGLKLRDVGVEGSSSLRVSENWALLGVVGYRRPTGGQATSGSDNFYSLLGMGYRF